MRYTTSAIFLDIWNKKNLIGRFFVPYVYAYCIFGVMPHVASSCGHFDTIAAALRQIERFLEPLTFWYLLYKKSRFHHHHHDHHSQVQIFWRLWKESQKKLFRNIYHISHCRTCGCLRGKEERKSFAFQYFQYFNFKKLEKPETFVRSEAQAFKKTHKWNNCRLECSVSLLFII